MGDLKIVMNERKPHVLLIDNEPDIVLTVGKRLEVSGFDVTVAKDGLVGIAKARAAHPDIVIVDLMMPKPNGIEVCVMFKEDQDLRDIPIILYSSLWSEKDDKLLADSRADLHVTKSQGTPVLLEAMTTLLNRMPRSR